MTQTKSAFKYETLYRGPYENVETWKNGAVNLRMGALTTRINIRNIKPDHAPIVEGLDPS